MEALDNNILIMGDFNAISNTREKEGGSDKSQISIGNFVEFINVGRLVDLGFVGNCFTWSNQRDGGNLIKECLDRVRASSVWRSSYPDPLVRHLPEIGSDHSPLILDSSSLRIKMSKRFKFQECWCTNDEARVRIL